MVLGDFFDDVLDDVAVVIAGVGGVQLDVDGGGYHVYLDFAFGGGLEGTAEGEGKGRGGRLEFVGASSRRWEVLTISSIRLFLRRAFRGTVRKYKSGLIPLSPRRFSA